MTTRIYVNRGGLAGENADPPFIVRATERGVERKFFFDHVEIEGRSRLVFNPEKPLPGDTRAWIETESRVTGWIDGHSPMVFDAENAPKRKLAVVCDLCEEPWEDGHECRPF